MGVRRGGAADWARRGRRRGFRAASELNQQHLHGPPSHSTSHTRRPPIQASSSTLPAHLLAVALAHVLYQRGLEVCRLALLAVHRQHDGQRHGARLLQRLPPRATRGPREGQREAPAFSGQRGGSEGAAPTTLAAAAAAAAVALLAGAAGGAAAISGYLRAAQVGGARWEPRGRPGA